MGFRRFMFRGVTKRATNGTLPAPPGPAPAAGVGRRGGLGSPAGRPRGEPAVRHGAARERGRRRSAYEAPHGSVAPGPASSGAESKRRRCPRSRARTSRVTLLDQDLQRVEPEAGLVELAAELRPPGAGRVERRVLDAVNVGGELDPLLVR